MQHLKKRASEKDAEHPYEEVLTYLTGKMDEDPEMQSYTDPYDNESCGVATVFWFLFYSVIEPCVVRF